jgi:drug/metabolite transporter (DMT)-like permease
MIDLVFCIISSTLIMVVFKIVERQNKDIFSAIVINYYTAVILGISIGGFPSHSLLDYQWFRFSLLMGVLFVFVFFIVGMSTKKAGIAITSITGKMSVILPISFSIIWFNESVSILKISGIILTIISLFLIIYSPQVRNSDNNKFPGLPVLLFFGVGIVDSLIKFTQETFIRGADTNTFSTVTFMVAGLTGTVVWLIRRFCFGVKVPIPLISGIVLGIVNFGSLYFIVKALDSGFADSSIIFGLNCIGIVGFSVFLGLVFFGEKLTVTKKIGIGLTVISIILLFYS